MDECLWMRLWRRGNKRTVASFIFSPKIKKFKNTPNETRKKREKRGPRAQRARAISKLRRRWGSLLDDTFPDGAHDLGNDGGGGGGEGSYSGQQRNTGRVWWGGVVIFLELKREREREKESGDNS